MVRSTLRILAVMTVVALTFCVSQTKRELAEPYKTVSITSDEPTIPKYLLLVVAEGLSPKRV